VTALVPGRPRRQPETTRARP